MELPAPRTMFTRKEMTTEVVEDRKNRRTTLVTILGMAMFLVAAVLGVHYVTDALARGTEADRASRTAQVQACESVPVEIRSYCISGAK